MYVFHKNGRFTILFVFDKSLFMTQRFSLHNSRCHYVLDLSYRYASECQNSPFLKDCLIVKIIIFGNKIITLLIKINCLVNCALEISVLLKF